MSVKQLAFLAIISVSATLLTGASCEKSAATPEDKSVIKAADNAASRPVVRTPVTGVDLAPLDGDAEKEGRFYGFVDRLASPCGKAESLRASIEGQQCKRAGFAARIIVALLADEADDEDIEEVYKGHYQTTKIHEFALAGVPHTGPADAPVKLVEFLDFGCGVCKRFAPILKEAIAEFPSGAVLYYKQFPLGAHPHSEGAAKAAVAAHAQGKFREMHDLLFERAPNHQVSELAEYAQQLGLDPQRFQVDFAAAADRIRIDKADGDKADIHGTPALYINGREYTGPHHPRYVRMWIEEELAVNR